MGIEMNIHTILNFWFNTLSPAEWWKKDADLDASIASRFSSIHHQATQGELFDWRETAEGCLAEVIILDQFSRNIFRNNPQSFAYDGQALILAQETIRRRLDKSLPTMQRAFLYLPFMHSESLVIHQLALSLFSQPGLESEFKFEQQHAEIIQRFGRYPYRNNILARVCTEEEKIFISEHPGF